MAQSAREWWELSGSTGFAATIAHSDVFGAKDVLRECKSDGRCAGLGNRNYCEAESQGYCDRSAKLHCGVEFLVEERIAASTA
jgi:hypothetical protein